MGGLGQSESGFPRMVGFFKGEKGVGGSNVSFSASRQDRRVIWHAMNSHDQAESIGSCLEGWGGRSNEIYHMSMLFLGKFRRGTTCRSIFLENGSSWSLEK